FSSFSHLTLCLSGPKSHLACVENSLVSCEGAHTAASSHCCPIPPAVQQSVGPESTQLVLLGFLTHKLLLAPLFQVYRLLTGLPPCQRTPGQGRVCTGNLPSSFSRCPPTSSSHVLSLRLRRRRRRPPLLFSTSPTPSSFVSATPRCCPRRHQHHHCPSPPPAATAVA
ncbi:hypothetical protein B0H14DRAFT_3894413, partial [Mycena olivaceomarginata]